MKALRNVFTMTGFTGAQAAVSAASALVATIALGPADRGVMVVGMTVGSFLAFAGGLGTGVALRARYPSSGGLGRVSLVSAYTWLSIAAAVFTPVLAIAAVAASAGPIDDRLGDPTFLLAVGIYASSQVLLVQLVEAWYADGLYRQAVASGAAMHATGFVAVLVCLEVSRTPASFLLAQGLGTLAACLVVTARLRRLGLIGLRRIRLAELLALLSVGAPALGVSAGLAIVMRVDRYILGLISGPAAVGVYSLAGTISEIPRLFAIATGQILLREASLGRGAGEFPRLVRIAVLITAAACLLVGVLGWFFIPWIFGPEFTGARTLLLVLLLAEVLFAPYAVASRGLLGGGWTGTAGLLGITGAAAAVGLYVLSARIAGPAGTAGASVALYAGLSAAACTWLRRRFRPTPVMANGTHASATLTKGSAC